jgi:hypothetical protein
LAPIDDGTDDDDTRRSTVFTTSPLPIVTAVVVMERLLVVGGVETSVPDNTDVDDAIDMIEYGAVDDDDCKVVIDDDNCEIGGVDDSVPVLLDVVVVVVADNVGVTDTGGGVHVVESIGVTKSADTTKFEMYMSYILVEIPTPKPFDGYVYASGSRINIVARSVRPTSDD